MDLYSGHDDLKLKFQVVPGCVRVGCISTASTRLFHVQACFFPLSTSSNNSSTPLGLAARRDPVPLLQKGGEPFNRDDDLQVLTDVRSFNIAPGDHHPIILFYTAKHAITCKVLVVCVDPEGSLLVVTEFVDLPACSMENLVAKTWRDLYAEWKSYYEARVALPKPIQPAEIPATLSVYGFGTLVSIPDGVVYGAGTSYTWVCASPPVVVHYTDPSKTILVVGPSRADSDALAAEIAGIFSHYEPKQERLVQIGMLLAKAWDYFEMGWDAKDFRAQLRLLRRHAAGAGIDLTDRVAEIVDTLGNLETIKEAPGSTRKTLEDQLHALEALFITAQS